MAVGKFSICLPFVLNEEGGESNDPRDPGGHTNRGITQARYDQYRASKHLRERSVSSISEPELQDIYRTGYWDVIDAESLRPGEDLSGFDYAVNSGPAKARAALVKASTGSPALAKVIDNIATARLSFLHGLANWQAFGRGWGGRVARIEAASLKMANLPIGPSLDSAKAKRKSNAAAAKSAGATAAGGGAAIHHFISNSLWIVAIVVGVVLVAAGVAAFNAWRQAQRVGALQSATAVPVAQNAAPEASKAAIVPLTIVSPASVLSPAQAKPTSASQASSASPSKG